ncbi:MAG: DegT/DnrJ/EryC1/StrS family aminotransferase [Thermoproteota archaeon]
MSELALLGGRRAVRKDPADMFTWPIVTKEMEDAVLEVLRAGKMSDIDVTQRFEKEFAEWHGVKYALAHNNGTSAIHGAMFGLGIGHGDEIICPSLTYWASCLPVYSLGGTVVFADVDPNTLCIDPKDIENRISKRTKAIVVVHYAGMPAEMDSIMEVARRHNLKVIEDVSHAHGALYKGRLVGTIGDVACFSIMSGKSFAAGEGGMMITNDRRVYERAIIFGHYERHSSAVQLSGLVSGAGLPWGGYKYRIHQLTSAVGLVQLRKYSREMEEIDKAMNYFWDQLEGTKGIRAHRPPKGSGTTKGGWYYPLGLYRSEELKGLSIQRFCEAVRAEGAPCSPGCNPPLHLHPVFNTIDIYGHGRPTRIANLPPGVDIRQPPGSLPVSERIVNEVFSVPWFKHFRQEVIDEYVEAFRKVSEHYEDLLPGDTKAREEAQSWGLTTRLRR